MVFPFTGCEETLWLKVELNNKIWREFPLIMKPNEDSFDFFDKQRNFDVKHHIFGWTPKILNATFFSDSKEAFKYMKLNQNMYAYAPAKIIEFSNQEMKDLW